MHPQTDSSLSLPNAGHSVSKGCLVSPTFQSHRCHTSAVLHRFTLDYFDSLLIDLLPSSILLSGVFESNA